VKIAVNKQDEMVVFHRHASMSAALKKGAEVVPVRIFHLWRARRGEPDLDLCLRGAQEMPWEGVDLLMAREMSKTITAMGFKHAKPIPTRDQPGRQAEWRRSSTRCTSGAGVQESHRRGKRGASGRAC